MARQDELWQGGPWEQPSPVFPLPPAVVIPAARRPVLRRRRGTRKKWLPFLVLLALIVSLTAGTVVLDRMLDAPDRGSVSPSAPAEDLSPSPTLQRAGTGTGVQLQLHPLAGEVLSFSEIYQAVSPSIVSIQSEGQHVYSTGTGVIMTQDGYLITNAHVIAGASRVWVLLQDNTVLEAKLVGTETEEDLAVLKVEAQGLTPAQFGESDALRHGDTVAAIGDSLGYRGTITPGIISGLDRDLDVDGVTMNLIQTSAAINFGNSGGALLNDRGQVVGITTVKIVANDGSAEGMGFAIPSTRVKYVVDRLIAGKPAQPPAFGITVHVQPTQDGHLRILSVHPDSNAAQAGILEGDLLLAVNNRQVHSVQDLREIKEALETGDTVTLTISRDGTEQSYVFQLQREKLFG